jgi:peptidoglycan/LPS O-acetylase OafA/YrhL
MNTAFIFGSFSFLAAASIYLLIKMRIQYILYSVVIALCLVQLAGAFFKIMHWTGADELLIVGFAGTILGAGLLIWKSIRNQGKQILFNKLIVGLMLLLQLALALFTQARELGGLLNYPVTALIATVIINDQSEHQGEKNMMIVFLMQAVFYLVSELLKSV